MIGMRNVKYEGIENEDIMHQMNSQLEDWEIEKFLKLKRDFAITSSPEKKKRIRYEMAVILGRVEEETSVAKQEAETEEKEEETRVSVKQSTMGNIRAEYEEINRELDEGNRDPRLRERYFELKQKAEELKQEEEKAPNLDAIDEEEQRIEQLVDTLSSQGAEKSESKHFESVELLPEELEMLLGDTLQVEETKVEEKSEPKVKSWFKSAREKLVGWKAARAEGRSEESKIVQPVLEESDLWTSEEMDEYEVSNESEFVVDELIEDVEEMEIEEIGEVESSERTEENADVVSEVTEKDIDCSDDSEVTEETKPEEEKRDPFQMLTDTQKKEMEAKIAEMVEKMVNERLQNAVMNSGTQSVVSEVKEEDEPVQEEKKSGCITEREKAVARAELKRKIKAMAKENEVLEYKGYEIDDLPSKFIVAELKLTGKLEKTGQRERKGIIYTKSEEILHVNENGDIMVGKYSQLNQNPFETSKKEQSQIGRGARGRRMTMGMDRG